MSIEERAEKAVELKHYGHNCGMKRRFFGIIQIGKEDDIAVVLVTHDKNTFVPKQDYHIGMRDELVVYRGE